MLSHEDTCSNDEIDTDGTRTFVLISPGLIEVRQPGASWNGLPDVADRFAFNIAEGETFREAVEAYLASEDDEESLR